MQRTFYIKALWDEEVERWISESDIRGLVIEAGTLEEFEEVIKEHAADLILANHIEKEEMSEKPLRELIPAILWSRPDTSFLNA